MNIKLLKELYKQAETECGWSEEKFAKLIVRECAEFANEHNEELEGVTLGVGQALKKHFGVEDVGS